jgi:thioester reductase-like protein
MSDYILLTGATGLLGQYLLRDLLRAGIPVAVLIRPKKEQNAQARVEEILARQDAEMAEPLPRPFCLEGDITSPKLGLSAPARRWVGLHCKALLHNAASLQFQGNNRDLDPWLSNLTGTHNVLQLCRAARIPELHYVSTAYVCGDQTGPILESTLDCGQTFRNDYEHSKLAAEKLVRDASWLDNRTIYRPAIIVGDSRTGYTTTYHALYTYFNIAWLITGHLERDADGRVHAPVRLNLTGEERRNLVPVDWVAAVISFLVRQREHHGRTYHLTPPHSTTARELEEAMASYFRYYGVTFAGPQGLAGQELSELEQLFYTYIERYQPYWFREPEFDCRNTLAAVPHLPCPRIDKACLHRLLDFAIADQWGKRRRKSPGRVPMTG